jgi:hypothetical protein
MSWALALTAVVYLTAAVFAVDPGDFVNCCVVGYLASLTARNSWEDGS